MKLEVLGCYGNRDKEKYTSCFRVGSSILIDAGNIMNGVEDLYAIKHIFLTHSHFDHIVDIPFLIDKIYAHNEKTINIYGSKETIDEVSFYIFNDKIWPKFQNINILNKNEKTIKFVEIKENESIIIDSIEIRPFLVEHTVKTFGYIINNEFLISGDTKLCDNLIKTINNYKPCLLYTSPSSRDRTRSRMPSSA
jgi:cAMP phosphodiesterase